ncbi:MAG: SDR family NAD(P)-dependent oxidoreductase [Muribaculaceae bacterium]|nr:SDR family NAD(P)-dependent oxidoreductase [Muribaculaceae bacterium]
MLDLRYDFIYNSNVMADNYLERRMEELRSGKLAVKRAIPGIKPKGRRILIAGGCHGIGLEKALEYRKQGCRVAVFDSDEVSGKRIAYEHGIRFHRVDIEDERAIRNEIFSLLSVWRGIDTLAGKEDICNILSKEITDWKESLPIADKSDVEIVIIDKTT